MSVHIVKEKVSLGQLKEWAIDVYSDMIKVVVDLERKVLAVGGELHSEMVDVLEQDGSSDHELWGVIVHFDVPAEDRVEKVSMINAGRVENKAMHIENGTIALKVDKLLDERIVWEE